MATSPPAGAGLSVAIGPMVSALTLTMVYEEITTRDKAEIIERGLRLRSVEHRCGYIPANIDTVEQRKIKSGEDGV